MSQSDDEKSQFAGLAYALSGQRIATLTLVQMLHRRGALDAADYVKALRETVSNAEFISRPDVDSLTTLADMLDDWLRGVSPAQLQ